jgi:hypothetical protein
VADDFPEGRGGNPGLVAAALVLGLVVIGGSVLMLASVDWRKAKVADTRPLPPEPVAKAKEEAAAAEQREERVEDVKPPPAAKAPEPPAPPQPPAKPREIPIQPQSEPLDLGNPRTKTRFSVLPDDVQGTLLKANKAIKEGRYDLSRVQFEVFSEHIDLFNTEPVKRWLIVLAERENVGSFLAAMAVPPERADKVKVSFALLYDPFAMRTAIGIAQKMRDKKADGLSEQEKAFVRRHPTLFGL